jgi:hypothetical protein
MSNLCMSCRNKTSKDRCPNSALPGLKFCGVHSKLKTHRLWTDVNDIQRRVILISKMWKGYFVRKKLKLAGPGVLQRSKCHNQEELLSFEPTKDIELENYFGFEENDKIYGFDVRTMFDSLNRNLSPINPYTRQPLSIDTRKRLRELYAYRFRNKLPVFYENNKLSGADVILSNRWLQLCQIAEENGFFNINPNLFLGLNRTQLYIFLTMILNDVKTWAAEHKDKDSKRFLYAYWIQNILNKYSVTQSSMQYSFYVSTILLTILYNSTEPYSLCFIIMSALYRL